MTQTRIHSDSCFPPDQVEAELGGDIDLNADHYWVVENCEQFDLSSTPQLGVAQLSDDIASVRSMIDCDDEPTVWHDLRHLIGVLQRIASLSLPGTPSSPASGRDG